MKNTFIQLFMVVCLGFMSACTSVENNADIDDASSEKDLLVQTDWLNGKWQNISGESKLTETWSRLDDTTMEGKTFFVEGKDTISNEVIQLRQRGNNVFYIASVSNQNNGKPVTFKLVKSTVDSLVFVNPEHDFPQKIIYRKVSNDSLVAEISGTINGKNTSEKFPMGRIK